MRKHLWAAALGGLGLVSSVMAAPVITVTPWLAPHVFGSPSFAGAQTNAIAGMLAGGVAMGSGPEAFTPQTTAVNSAEAIVTGFASWRGVTNPGTNLGAAYANEYGNRMTFALFIDGDGEQFSISQLGFSATSSDPGNALGFGYGAGSYAYSAGYVGIRFGLDGALGGGDDVYLDSNLFAATELVDALVGRGSGNSFAAYCPGCDETAQAASIAAVAGFFGPGTVSYTGTYTLSGGTAGPTASGAGTFRIVTNAVPEPSSLLLVALGAAALGAAGRRRESSKA